MKIKDFTATEKQDHISLVHWARMHPLIKDIFLHINNEGRRSPQYALLLRRLGMVAGVSDFFLPLPTLSRDYCGLWLELKRSKGAHLSDKQKWWLDTMNDNGYYAVDAYGLDNAIATIEWYLKQK